MVHFVPSPVSIRFDFQNPEGWNAHARRDLIEALSAFVDEITPSLLLSTAKRSQTTVESEERVVRAHTPWVGEGETQIVLIPVIPPSLVAAARANQEKIHTEFSQTIVGKGLDWLLNKLDKDEFAQHKKDMAQKIIDEQVEQDAANWVSALLHPLLMETAEFLYRNGHATVFATITTPTRQVRTQIVCDSQRIPSPKAKP